MALHTIFHRLLRPFPRRDQQRSLDDMIEELAGRALAAGASEETISDAVHRATQESGVVLAAELEKRMPKMVREHRKFQRRFERRLRARWGRALDLFYAVYVSCLELGEEINRRRPPSTSDDYRTEALVRLHARSCMVASDVYALLCSGHPNGAMARARTLHEYAVVAYVLAEGTNADAERYLLHAAVDNYKRATAFQPVAERLGYEPFAEEEMQALRKSYDELLARFGSDFRSQYGWASSIGVSRPTFRDLEMHAGISHLRPYYQWYSDAVHAGAKAAESALVVRGPHSVLLAGPTNSGLADPAQSAVVALTQITTTLVVSRKPLSAEDLLALVAIRKLMDKAADAFIDAHKALEEDEEAIDWSDDMPA
jgi:hypothetical protein